MACHRLSRVRSGWVGGKRPLGALTWVKLGVRMGYSRGKGLSYFLTGSAQCRAPCTLSSNHFFLPSWILNPFSLLPPSTYTNLKSFIPFLIVKAMSKSKVM